MFCLTFQVKLSSITSVSLLDKRGFLTICLTLGTIREGRIYLRRAEGLREWFSLLKVGEVKWVGGTNFWFTKTSPFQFHVDQKKPPRLPSYSFLPETKMTGALAGGKKRSSKNEMASDEIVMMMIVIMTLLQMLMMRVQTTLSGTRRAMVPPPQMCQRASTDYHVSTVLSLLHN